MDQGDDPYKILGIDKDATTQDVKKAYRKLALKHHPDRVSDPAAKEKAQNKFAKISNAYELLSDDQERREYDRQPSGTGLRGTTTKRGGKFTPHFPFNDPYEVFKRDFQQQFGIPYPGESYDWDDSDDPAPANVPMITAGGENNKRSLNPFRRNKKPQQQQQQQQQQQSRQQNQPQKNNSKSSKAQSQSQALVVRPETSTAIIETPGRNNRPISMETKTTSKMVNGKKQTRTETIIKRPDGSTETLVTIDGLRGPKPLMIEGQKQVPMLTNGKQVPRLTNGKKKKKKMLMLEQARPEQARPVSSSKPKRGLLGWGGGK